MNYLEVVEILDSIKAYNKSFRYSYKDEKVARNDREREILHNENLQILKPYLDVLMPLDFEIAKKALQTIVSNDKYSYRFNDMPVPTVVSLTIQMTDFDADEKRKYFDNLEVYYAIDDLHGVMLAYNKRTGEPSPQKNRPMNAIEEDYYVKNLMSEAEYRYFNKQTNIKPIKIHYDPKTRTNDLLVLTPLMA